MEEIHDNVELEEFADPKRSWNQTGPRRSHRSFRSVLFCLGLLSVFLLVGRIVLGVLYCDSTADLSSIREILTERLQASNDELSSMTAERDRLNASLTEMTEERDRLQSESKQNQDSAADLSSIREKLTERLQASNDELSSMTAERDRLNASLTEMTEEHDRLQKETCPAGWKMFSCSCYFLSQESGSWMKGREDCRSRGADLVVINRPEEQRFLITLKRERTWIGLNDIQTEGTWMWVDETPLTLSYWSPNQPDSNGGGGQWGDEDCAEIRYDVMASWNDAPCTLSLQWICEKQ